MKKQSYHFEGVSETTRKNMQRIRSKDTSIEVLLRKRLWHDGFRYRKNYKQLPGSPDIAITKQKIAVFCDSEFFHGKDWNNLQTRLKHGKNPEYWIEHIEKNIDNIRVMKNDEDNNYKLIEDIYEEKPIYQSYTSGKKHIIGCEKINTGVKEFYIPYDINHHLILNLI